MCLIQWKYELVITNWNFRTSYMLYEETHEITVLNIEDKKITCTY